MLLCGTVARAWVFDNHILAFALFAVWPCVCSCVTLCVLLCERDRVKSFRAIGNTPVAFEERSNDGNWGGYDWIPFDIKDNLSSSTFLWKWLGGNLLSNQMVILKFISHWKLWDVLEEMTAGPGSYWRRPCPGHSWPQTTSPEGCGIINRPKFHNTKAMTVNSNTIFNAG